jgi:hypothetical protein
MEALSSVKMTLAHCLGTVNMCLFWISLTTVWHCPPIVTVVHWAYGGLFFSFFFFRSFSSSPPPPANGLSYFTNLLSCMELPGVIHPTGLTAVYGCTSGRLWISPNLALSVLSVTASLRSTWLASECIEADVKQVITSWLQTLETGVFTLEYMPWYYCGEIPRR